MITIIYPAFGFVRPVNLFCVLVFAFSITFEDGFVYGADGYQTIAKQLGEYKALNGVAPDVDVFLNLVFNNTHSNPFSNKDLEGLYQLLASLQSPVISKGSLLAIFSGKRKSIKTYRAEYEEIIVTIGDGQIRRKMWQKEHVFKGDKFFLASLPLERDNAGHTRFSYDGEVKITLSTRPSGSGGSFGRLDRKSTFFDASSPLVSSMLFDFEAVGMRPVSSSDIIHLLGCPTTYVFEKTRRIDGINCIVVGNPYILVFLSPELDYSVVGTVIYQYEHNNRGHLTSYFLHGRSLLSDIVDCGNGIWLPKKARFFRFNENGDTTYERTVNASTIEINKDIDDSFFTDFIPDGIFIANRDTGEYFHYRKVASLSINALLQSTVKSKRTWFLQYLSVTVGILLIILYCALKYREHLKRKQTA